MNYIIHPLTNSKLPLNSNEAKTLLKQYVSICQTGGSGMSIPAIASEAHNKPLPNANPDNFEGLLFPKENPIININTDVKKPNQREISYDEKWCENKKLEIKTVKEQGNKRIQKVKNDVRDEIDNITAHYKLHCEEDNRFSNLSPFKNKNLP